jgi:hypothetical protein
MKRERESVTINMASKGEYEMFEKRGGGSEKNDAVLRRFTL